MTAVIDHEATDRKGGGGVEICLLSQVLDEFWLTMPQPILGQRLFQLGRGVFRVERAGFQRSNRRL